MLAMVVVEFVGVASGDAADGKGVTVRWVMADSQMVNGTSSGSGEVSQGSMMVM